MFNILIINGPNLNLLGEREKDKYGNTSIEKLKKIVYLFLKNIILTCLFFNPMLKVKLLMKFKMQGIIKIV